MAGLALRLDRKESDLPPFQREAYNRNEQALREIFVFGWVASVKK